MNDPTTDLTTLIDLYLLRCDVEGKSPGTTRAYRETLRRFTRALTSDAAPTAASEVEAVHIYAYLGRYTHLRMETRHRYFREVRCFFNWLVDAGHLERNPFRGMRNVRVPQRTVQPFSGEEIGQLLAACGDGAMGARNLALLLTLLDTGAW